LAGGGVIVQQGAGLQFPALKPPKTEPELLALAIDGQQAQLRLTLAAEQSRPDPFAPPLAGSG
jgi:hypothetical protein